MFALVIMNYNLKVKYTQSFEDQSVKYIYNVKNLNNYLKIDKHFLIINCNKIIYPNL